MTAHDEMLDNVAVYALGLLPAEEAAKVAAHLEICAECREEYRLLGPSVTALGYSAEACADAGSGATAVSPLLKQRLMRQVRSEAPARRHPALWVGYALAAACLAFALLAGLAGFVLTERVGRDRIELARQAATIHDLAAADAKRYRFGRGSVLVHGERLYIALPALPAPPPGKVYQAWTLPKGSKRMAPSITFEPQAGGQTVVRLPQSAANVAAVAVSVEPAGGSLQPTTKPIAIATL
ncbi:MAG: anti-sigma factor [Candidatus Baltobacteraceae bacterium]